MAISNTSKMEKRMDTLFLEGGLEICIKEKKNDTHMLFALRNIFWKKKKKHKHKHEYFRVIYKFENMDKISLSSNAGCKVSCWIAAI